ncbi:lecithin retinol acyltransferase family protein [Pseudomonas sp. KCJK8927]|uniref:lecithin retinol acyltransferase family protein n=1 Tax=Pseudomonas sp. KCJK8927 TaxID=3344560 RepID=UPI003905EF35
MNTILCLATFVVLWCCLTDMSTFAALAYLGQVRLHYLADLYLQESALEATLCKCEAFSPGIPVGSHLISPRSFYIHHGVYLGRGFIIHYPGWRNYSSSGPIEITDVIGFAQGEPVLRLTHSDSYSSSLIVERAMSRVGENSYNILTNNCEHFCNWCINGTNSCSQIIPLLFRPLAWLELIVSLRSASHSRQPQRLGATSHWNECAKIFGDNKRGSYER